MGQSWISIIPPVILFITACFSRNILLSFCLSILTAALLKTNGAVFDATKLLVQRISIYIFDLDTLCLHLFLLGIGVLITFFSITRTRYGRTEKSILHRFSRARTVEYVALIVAPLFCIDDYLSILTLGFLMKQLAEAARISRERLAFIVQSLGGPFVILAPISSWAAAITSQFDQAGVQAIATDTTTILCDPLFLYVQSIPYIFYSLFLLFSLFFLINRQIILEKKSEQHLLTQQGKTVQQFSLTQLTDIFFAIAFLITSVLIGLLYSGGFPTKGMLEALKTNSSSFLVLCVSLWGVVVVTILRGIFAERVFFSDFVPFIRGGIQLMYQSMAIVALASIFGAFIRYDLKTGDFLAALCLQNIAAHSLPFVTFISSLLITFATGSAWGTYALMIPLLIPIILSVSEIQAPATELLPLFHTVFGALFSAGVCGNHLSPFAETTTMAASAFEISAMRHATTQFIYAIPTICATVVAYAVIGLPFFATYTFVKIFALGVFVSICSTLVTKQIITRY
jgi:Na+/H+ antiporter NhaC